MGGERTVHVEGLTVRYGRKCAVEDVSFSVQRGSVYALLGRNGAGKSSIIRCLLGQQKPQSGAAYLFEKQVWNQRTKAMHKVGVVPEEPDAPPEMTARQLAALCSPLYSTWDRGSFEARIHRFGIPDNLPFKNLSKGQKGMLHFALALAPKPDLLVLDDPTLGLDVVARKSTFEDLVSDLADRAPTVLITTHDLQGVEGIADRVGILKQGRLMVDMPTEVLKSRYRILRYRREKTPAEEASCGDLDMFTALDVRTTGSSVEAVISDFDEDTFGRFRCAGGVRDAEVAPMSLEEILIAVAGEHAEDRL